MRRYSKKLYTPAQAEWCRFYERLSSFEPIGTRNGLLTGPKKPLQDSTMKSDAECAAQCLLDLCARLTPYLTSAIFRRQVGLKRIVLSSTLKSLRGWRGEALWRKGDIVLDARDCSRYRTASMYSKPDGKADMSPTGVAAHEQGHFLWFADSLQLDRGWNCSAARKRNP